MKYTYYTQGTCSSQIDMEVDDQGILRDVEICKASLSWCAV